MGSYTYIYSQWLWNYKWWNTVRTNQLNILRNKIFCDTFTKFFICNHGFTKSKHTFYNLAPMISHNGLNPDRFLPMGYPRSYYFLVPVRFLDLCNNQGICLEFYLIYIHLNPTTLTLTTCISLSCKIDVLLCKTFVGVRLSYFKSNLNDLFGITCNLDQVSLA